MKRLFIVLLSAAWCILSSCEESPVSDEKDTIIGVLIEYRGEYDSVPANPSLNWVYRNTSTHFIYCFNGNEWVIMMNDGVDTSKSVSVYTTFHNNLATNPPPKPTGNGTAPAGWYRIKTDSAIWVSQKLSIEINSGSWETPINIKNPLGSAGRDGGFVYFDGFKPDLKCATCHSPGISDTTYGIVSKKMQYEASTHIDFGNYDRSSAQCAGCHTNEGFYERYKKGFFTETFTVNMPSGPITTQSYPNASPVGCFTCHSPHKSGDFVIRDSSAVKIFSIVAGQTMKVVSPTTSSRICIKCHQPRMTSTFLIPGSVPTSWQPNPASAVADTAKIYTSRWNNHGSGEQTQVLLGFGGFEFQGYTYGNSFHSQAFNNHYLGCESCHMATPVGNRAGGHTFKIGYIPEGSSTLSFNLSGCNTSVCHGASGAITTTSAKWKNVREEINAKLTQLGMLMMDTSVTKKWSVPKNGKAVAWVSFTVSGYDTAWTVANASASSPLQIIPAVKAGALWNFQHVLLEKSLGIHNTSYVRSLLDASITELKKP